MKKIGLIINPIAGMGGSVGLKGTDGVIDEAILRGAVPKAEEKAKKALKELLSVKDKMEIVTCSGNMGQDIAEELGFRTNIVYKCKSNQTNCQDTLIGMQKIMSENIDLILFAGGDGTARNIYEIAGEKLTAIGIPAGVKIHSPVYAQTPSKAGELAKLYITEQTTLTREAEVLDIDENEYRQGRVNTKLYGYLKVPFERRFMQNRKAGTPVSERNEQISICSDVIKNMDKDTYYIIGPGSTTRPIMEILGLKYTLIGVDIVYNEQTVGTDLSENEIMDIIGDKPAKLVITPTGGQGYLLGRGNQQLSGDLVKLLGKTNIIVLSTKEKIASLNGAPLLVDTGDDEADSVMRGYMRIISGYRETIIYPIK